jgi:tetratricopeptide (TPR) repeat protein
MSIPQSAPPPGAASPNYPSPATLKQLVDANEATWMDLGRLAEKMDDNERARAAYEAALKNNHDSIPAKKAIAILYKDKFKNTEKVHAEKFWLRIGY